MPPKDNMKGMENEGSKDQDPGNKPLRNNDHNLKMLQTRKMSFLLEDIYLPSMLMS